MKTLILCKSVHHQNTTLIARVMADVLSADLRAPEETSPDILKDYDLIGFGSGIYFGRFHSALRACIDQLPDVASSGRSAFVFSTAGLPSLWRWWHRPLKALLKNKGFIVVAEFHCSGFDTFGPLWLFGGIHRRHPDHHDEERAAEFARQLISVASAFASTNHGQSSSASFAKAAHSSPTL
jgi:flavodoxin